MKNLIFLSGFIFLFSACVEKESTPKGGAFTFNKPGGAPVKATVASGMSLVSPSTSPSFNSRPTLLVSGVVNGENVSIYNNSTCTTIVGSAVAVGTSATITTSALAIGIHNFYVKTSNLYTTSSCSASLLSYQYLGVSPVTATGMTLQSPTSSPASVASPVILLTGVVAGETSYLYIDSSCATSYGSAVATGTTVAITSSALAPGIHQFYTNSSNTAGTGSCSGALLTYQYTGVFPTSASTLIYHSPDSSPNYDSTPTLIAGGGVANGDTVSLYTDASCSTLVGSALSSGTNVQITTSALAVGTHSFYSNSTNVIGTSACSAFLQSYNYLGPAPVVTVSWSANREAAVNKAGGGYRVYYSRSSGFDIATASYVDVPYVAGPTAPVSKTFSDLLMGITYFKVQAFSSLNAPGSTSGSWSAASSQFSVSLP